MQQLKVWEYQSALRLFWKDNVSMKKQHFSVQKNTLIEEQQLKEWGYKSTLEHYKEHLIENTIQHLLI